MKNNMIQQYKLDGRSLLIKNGKGLYNRSIYYNGRTGYLVGGDYPAVKIIAGDYFWGSFIIAAYDEGNKLCCFENYETRFYPNRIEYIIGLDKQLRITILPSSCEQGVCVRIQGTKQKIAFWWAGMYAKKNGIRTIRWDFDPGRYLQPVINIEEQKELAFEQISDNHIYIKNNAGDRRVSYTFEGTPVKAQWQEYEAGLKLPQTVLNVDGEIYIYAQVYDAGGNISPKKEFKKARQRNADELKLFKIKTPNAHLNLIADFAGAANNALYADGVYNHGACSWSVPFIGWENICGAAVMGQQRNIEEWVSKVQQKVVRVDEKKTAIPSLKHEYTVQDENSRLYGLGYIDFYQGEPHIMQSQYYDQLIYISKKMDSDIIRAALLQDMPLHAKWQDDCFDPQDSGVYESVINTFPTDSIWYNGGKGVEETMFAYNVNDCLAKLTGKDHYKQKAEKIKKAFHDELWIQDKGHPCFYKDVIGEQLVHENAWNYSIYYAVISDLTDDFEKVQAMYYLEYALETVKINGGKRTYCSNLVPYIWSIRDKTTIYEYQTAECYWKAGLNETAWQVFRDGYMPAFFSSVPGELDANTTSSDFAVTSALFLRALNDGLFGVHYENAGKKLEIKPGFPRRWKYVEFVSDKLKYVYRCLKNKVTVEVDCDCKDITIILPTYCRKVERVEGGCFTIKKGMLTPLVEVKAKTKCIEIEFSGTGRPAKEKYIELKQGEKFPVKGLIDPEKVFWNGKAEKEGHHTVFSDCGEYYKVYRLHVQGKETLVDNEPIIGEMEEFPLKEYFNGDITKIYEQQYLTPRVNTCSTQLSINGFNAWTYTFWGMHPPKFSLSKPIKKQICGVPFAVADQGDNALMISQYDNYPTQVEVAVGQTVQGISILFAGSTNHMQCEVPAARIELIYQDGTKTVKEIIPPYNFLGICDLKEYTEDGHNTSYDDPRHQFPLRGSVAKTELIGDNCRANVLFIPTENKQIEKVAFRAIANETVIGIMGITLIK